MEQKMPTQTVRGLVKKVKFKYMYGKAVYINYMFRDAHQDLAKIGDLSSSSDRIK